MFAKISGRWWTLTHSGGGIVKVIFENSYLQDRHKIRLCEICAEVGADFVKTSTGYSCGGATHRGPEADAQAFAAAHSGQSGGRNPHIGRAAGSAGDRRGAVRRHPYGGNVERMQAAAEKPPRSNPAMSARIHAQAMRFCWPGFCGGVWFVVAPSAGSPPADAVDEAPKELLFKLAEDRRPGPRPRAAHLLVRAVCRSAPRCWTSMATASSTSPPDGTTILAPNWTKYSDYRDGAATNGPDVDDNYEGTMDVNNDGRMDVLSSGWMLQTGHLLVRESGQAGREVAVARPAAGGRAGRNGHRESFRPRRQGRAGQLLRAESRAAA